MGDPLAIHLGWWSWDHGGGYLPALGGGVPFSNMWGWVGAISLISLLARLWNSRFDGRGSRLTSVDPLLFPLAVYTAWFCMAAYSLLYFRMGEPLFVGLFTMGSLVAVFGYRLIAGRTSRRRLEGQRTVR